MPHSLFDIETRMKDGALGIKNQYLSSEKRDKIQEDIRNGHKNVEICKNHNISLKTAERYRDNQAAIIKPNLFKGQLARELCPENSVLLQLPVHVTKFIVQSLLDDFC